MPSRLHPGSRSHFSFHRLFLAISLVRQSGFGSPDVWLSSHHTAARLFSLPLAVVLVFTAHSPIDRMLARINNDTFRPRPGSAPLGPTQSALVVGLGSAGHSPFGSAQHLCS